MRFETNQAKPKLGQGIYSIPDVAKLLNLPYKKVSHWLNTLWNGKLGYQFQFKYSWNIDLTKAVNFYTLIEFFTFYQLSEAGVASKKLLELHTKLSSQFNTPYPFANQKILKKIKTDGKNIFIEDSEGIYSYDKLQFYFDFIKDFFKNIDFDSSEMAVRLWPLGKSRSVVCDPSHQFGHPVIVGTNIPVETLWQLYNAGESVDFISSIYSISPKQVLDSVEFCNKAA